MALMGKAPMGKCHFGNGPFEETALMGNGHFGITLCGTARIGNGFCVK